MHQFNFVGLSHLGSTPQHLSWVPPIAIASNAQALTEKMRKMRIIHIRCAACHEWVVSLQASVKDEPMKNEGDGSEPQQAEPFI